MEIKHDRINDLLRDEHIDEVNDIIAAGNAPSFSDTNLGGLNLSELNVQGLDFSNSRFCHADLRGLDLSTCNLRGASLKEARISGALFPNEISAQEIIMSLKYGTRIRY
ncbi:MAG: pentapeptide repeat-containing protein [Mariprofundus sp.]|nr:pentapeptide repeat-containing protein [Mariprofundus sp.]